MNASAPELVFDADAGLVGIGRIGADPNVRSALVDTITVGRPELSVDATSLIELVAAICGAQSRLCDDVLLHAGAVVDPSGQSALLLSGPSMAGKSTLCAWLVQRGWGYLTDELVRVLPDGRVSSWRKPISLRQSSAEVLGLDIPAMTPASNMGTVASGDFRVGGIVLLEARAGGVAPVSSAETAARLMQEATRFDGGDHLFSLAAAVQGSKAIRLGRAPLEVQEQVLVDLMTGQMPHPRKTSSAAIEGAALKDEVTAVLLGDEMIAYNENSRRVAVLDLRAFPMEPERLPTSAREMLDLPDVSRRR